MWQEKSAIRKWPHFQMPKQDPTWLVLSLTGSETQIPESTFLVGLWLVLSVVGAFSLLGGEEERGAEENWSWAPTCAADEKHSKCLARAKAPPPSLAGFKEFEHREQGAKKTPADLS